MSANSLLMSYMVKLRDSKQNSALHGVGDGGDGVFQKNNLIYHMEPYKPL